MTPDSHPRQPRIQPENSTLATPARVLLPFQENGIPAPGFTEIERQAVYKAIYERRDIRAFRPDPIPVEVLAHILDAAHHAGSVGFMQPWDFLVISDPQKRAQVKALFAKERQAAACFFEEPRRSQYLALKLEGIEECPVNICVTCDPTRGGPQVLGRNSIPETDVYSTCGAVQNLWLAARAEGIGVGWVSILKNAELRQIFTIPPHIIPIAYLCLGYVDHFPERPVLATVGWRQRLPLPNVVAYEQWGQREHSSWQGLGEQLTRLSDAEGNGAGSRRGMKKLLDVISQVRPPDEASAAQARARQDQLTKPQGSLGLLEDLSIRLAAMTGKIIPTLGQKLIVVMAADHGVSAEGVSAYPAEVTPQMVANFLAGGAAINVLARRAGARLAIVDAGVASDLPADPHLISCKIAHGTANISTGPAMTREQAVTAILNGVAIIEAEAERGLDVVGTGDMGIGNTTASAAILAAITGAPLEQVVGRGTGLDDAGLLRKREVIRRALAINKPDANDPLDVLAKVGGFEIAGLVGVILAGAARRLPVVIDGFISGAAALLAAELCPAVRLYLIAAHLSQESGHRVLLAHLGLHPLLDLHLRLGEGTGAALALPLLDAAVAILRDMSTFAQAGVARAVE